MAKHLALAAARADNFYYPPDMDPSKVSLDKYNGQHPLRERARKMHEGILIIRFEMPFNVWCDGCGELIGKGVRFNAEKKQVGMYHSTKTWSFKMRHHCGCEIEVVTDPKQCEYVINHGAKRKEEAFDARAEGAIDIPDDAEKKRLESDPFYRLEKQGARKASLRDQKADLAAVTDISHQRNDSRNQARLMRTLKRDMRVKRSEAAALDKRREELGLPEHLKLKADTAEETAEAERTFRAKRCPSSHRTVSRTSIMTQDIFASAGAKAKKRSSALGVGSGAKVRKQVSASRKPG